MVTMADIVHFPPGCQGKNGIQLYPAQYNTTINTTK